MCAQQIGIAAPHRRRARDERRAFIFPHFTRALHVNCDSIAVACLPLSLSELPFGFCFLSSETRERLSHAFSGVGSGVESLSDYMPPMPRGRQGRGGGAGMEEGTLITWIIIDFPLSRDGARTVDVTKRHSTGDRSSS